MVPNCQFRSVSDSEPNRPQSDSPDYQDTHLVKSGMVKGKSPKQSRVHLASAGCPAGPFVDSSNVLAFAIG
jgi:hypothetical protein